MPTECERRANTAEGCEAEEVSVLCVDDNALVAEALRIKLMQEPGFVWKGWLPDAGNLAAIAKAECPSLVLLDVDMPGKDSFTALGELLEACPDSRVIMFSGHIRPELIDRAVEAGAWGYVAKSDGERAFIDAMHRVLAGHFALSPEVRASYQR